MEQQGTELKTATSVPLHAGDCLLALGALGSAQEAVFPLVENFTALQNEVLVLVLWFAQELDGFGNQVLCYREFYLRKEPLKVFYA